MEYKELIDFIIKAQKDDYSNQEIKEALKKAGWRDNDIENGFYEASKISEKSIQSVKPGIKEKQVYEAQSTLSQVKAEVKPLKPEEGFKQIKPEKIPAGTTPLVSKHPAPAPTLGSTPLELSAKFPPIPDKKPPSIPPQPPIPSSPVVPPPPPPKPSPPPVSKPKATAQKPVLPKLETLPGKKLSIVKTPKRSNWIKSTLIFIIFLGIIGVGGYTAYFYRDKITSYFSYFTSKNKKGEQAETSRGQDSANNTQSPPPAKEETIQDILTKGANIKSLSYEAVIDEIISSRFAEPSGSSIVIQKSGINIKTIHKSPYTKLKITIKKEGSEKVVEGIIRPDGGYTYYKETGLYSKINESSLISKIKQLENVAFVMPSMKYFLPLNKVAKEIKNNEMLKVIKEETIDGKPTIVVEYITVFDSRKYPELQTARATKLTIARTISWIWKEKGIPVKEVIFFEDIYDKEMAISEIEEFAREFLNQEKFDQGRKEISRIEAHYINFSFEPIDDDVFQIVTEKDIDNNKGETSYQGTFTGDKKRIADLIKIKTILDQYYEIKGVYPATTKGGELEKCSNQFNCFLVLEEKIAAEGIAGTLPHDERVKQKGEEGDYGYESDGNSYIISIYLENPQPSSYIPPNVPEYAQKGTKCGVYIAKSGTFNPYCFVFPKE